MFHESILRKAHERETATKESYNPFVSLGELEMTCEGNEVLQELLADLKRYVSQYAETVLRFEQIVLAGGDRKEIDHVRSTKHDATIDAIKILARTLKREGKGCQWIGKLGKDRSKYGKFAILLAFEQALSQEKLEAVYE